VIWLTDNCKQGDNPSQYSKLTNKKETMRYRNLILPALTALLMTSAGSATAIIDSSTLNGSFESGSDGAIDLWEPAFNSNREERISNNSSAGTYSAVIGNTTLEVIQPGETAPLAEPILNGLALNTGYTVVSGETYDLSFDWIPLFLWDDDDQIDFRLFTTSDNTTSGTVSEIYVSAVTGHAQGDGYQTDLDLTGIGTVQAADIGQDLWIEFWSSTAAGVEDVSTGEFARVDDVRLTAVPEPATYALLGGFFALGCVLLRRRLRG